MKKIILPMVALAMSVATVAQASSSSFNFYNFTNTPILVFAEGDSKSCSSNGCSGIFILPFLFKNIKLSNWDYEVRACWTTLDVKWESNPTTNDCVIPYQDTLKCQNDSPDKVIATGIPFFNASGPNLACTNFTLEANKSK